MKTLIENKHLRNGGYFCFFLPSFIVDRACCKWTGRGADEVNKRMKYLLLCVDVVVKTLNLEISRCHLADYVKELY